MLSECLFRSATVFPGWFRGVCHRVSGEDDERGVREMRSVWSKEGSGRLDGGVPETWTTRKMDLT